LLGACNQQVPPSQLSEQGQQLSAVLSTLNLANPTLDVQAAITRGDTRSIGLNGFACHAPGIEGSSLPPGIGGIRCLDGTSDVIIAGEEALHTEAEKYAVAYNHELLRRLERGR